MAALKVLKNFRRSSTGASPPSFFSFIAHFLLLETLAAFSSLTWDSSRAPLISPAPPYLAHHFLTQASFCININTLVQNITYRLETNLQLSLAIMASDTATDTANSVNRYSMPVTKSRTAFYDVNLDQANTTGFLFGDDNDGTEGKIYTATNEDNFPTLVRREPNMVSFKI